MIRKTISVALLLLFTVMMLNPAFNVLPAKASGAIYIRDDGTIDPPTAPIKRQDGLCTLTGNIQDCTIFVETSNIVIDGANYTLQGTGVGSGIATDCSSTGNVTIKNLKIKGFETGIWTANFGDGTITGNAITECGEGIHLANTYGIGNNAIYGNNISGDINIWGSWGNTIYQNKIAGSINLLPSDVTFDSSDNNAIFGNVIGGYISLSDSSDNTISGNTVTSGGISLVAPTNRCYNNTISANSILGNIDLYMMVENNSIFGNIVGGGIGCSDGSSNNRITGNNITSGGISLVRYSDNNIVAGNSIIGGGISWMGEVILQWGSSNNTISGNVITNSVGCGIYIDTDYGPATDNKILGNNITNNVGDGIYFYSELVNNTISGNNIMNNGGSGIVMYTPTYDDSYDSYSGSNMISGNNIAGNAEDGILLLSSSNNTIFGNNVTNNDSGIVLNWTADYFGGFFYSENNTIVGNNIKNNKQFGINLLNSSDNFIYHNNFVNNAKQVYSENSINAWDNGYPSGGNYWSDYNGSDLYLGEFQTEPGSDEIGDTSYVIDGNNTDHYPLMSLWTPPDVAVINVTSAKRIIGEGYSAYLTALVENQGNKIENLNVTVYVGETPVTFQTFLLKSGDSLNHTFPWNSTGFAKGNYTLIALIEPIEGEEDLADNTMYNDWVFITIPGDVNGDKKVNVLDAIVLSDAIFSEPSEPNWNANADINNDGKVNILDCIILGNHMGQSWA